MSPIQHHILSMIMGSCYANEFDPVRRGGRLYNLTRRGQRFSWAYRDDIWQHSYNVKPFKRGV